MTAAQLPKPGTVRRAVHDELVTLGALASTQGATALALAKDVDSGDDRTAAARELRMQMTELRESKAKAEQAKPEDELAKMREAAQARAAG